MIRALLACTMAIVVAPFAHGQYCNAVQAQVVTHVAQHYNQVVQIAPTFAFAVPVPVYSYVNAPGYVQGGVIQAPQQVVAQPQQQAVQQPSVEQIADLVVQKMQAAGLRPGYPVSTNNGAFGPPPAVKKPGVLPSAVPWAGSSEVEAILVKKCANCHGGDGSAGGGLVFFNNNRLVKLTREQKFDIFDACYENVMPKGGPYLSDDEVEKVRKWAKARN